MHTASKVSNRNCAASHQQHSSRHSAILHADWQPSLMQHDHVATPWTVVASGSSTPHATWPSESCRPPAKSTLAALYHSGALRDAVNPEGMMHDGCNALRRPNRAQEGQRQHGSKHPAHHGCPHAGAFPTQQHELAASGAEDMPGVAPSSKSPTHLPGYHHAEASPASQPGSTASAAKDRLQSASASASPMHSRMNPPTEACHTLQAGCTAPAAKDRPQSASPAEPPMHPGVDPHNLASPLQHCGKATSAVGGILHAATSSQLPVHAQLPLCAQASLHQQPESLTSPTGDMLKASSLKPPVHPQLHSPTQQSESLKSAAGDYLQKAASPKLPLHSQLPRQAEVLRTPQPASETSAAVDELHAAQTLQPPLRLHHVAEAHAEASHPPLPGCITTMAGDSAAGGITRNTGGPGAPSTPHSSAATPAFKQRVDALVSSVDTACTPLFQALAMARVAPLPHELAARSIRRLHTVLDIQPQLQPHSSTVARSAEPELLRMRMRPGTASRKLLLIRHRTCQ